MYNNFVVKDYDDLIEQVDSQNFLETELFNDIKCFVANKMNKSFNVSFLRPSVETIIEFITSNIPKARYGFSCFPEGVSIKEKDKPDKTVFYYAWVKFSFNKIQFIDWTVAHKNLECAMMIAALKTLKDMERKKINDLQK